MKNLQIVFIVTILIQSLRINCEILHKVNQINTNRQENLNEIAFG